MARKQVLTPYAIKTIAASGTPEAIQALEKFVKSITISALETNTDFIYIGNSSLQNYPLAPGNSIIIQGDALDLGGHGIIDISQIYVRVIVNGEGVSYLTLDGV